MNIVHIVLGKANPERMNGVNKVVHELAWRQSEAGWQVEIWGISADLRHNYPSRPFTTRLFQAKAFPFSLDASLRRAIADKAGTTVFHLHGGFIPSFAALSACIVRHGGRFVFTPHGSYNTLAMRKNKVIKMIYYRLFEKRLLQKASQIHCLGYSETQGLSQLMPQAKPALIAYGFEAGNLPAARPEPPFTIAFCGRLDWFTKGLDVLLEGFARFSAYAPEARLWIIGDGEGKAALRRLAAQLHLGDRVVFWGGRFGEEKINLLSQAHVFAHPSRNEGLPVSVLEAAAMGLPCLVSRATNIGDTVATYQAGRVINHVEASELALALRQLYQALAHPEGASELRRNARLMVEAAFNWQGQLLAFERMYRQAAGKAYTTAKATAV